MANRDGHKDISIELVGEIPALEALAAVSKHAAFAQKSALRAAGRNGRSGIVKEVAARYRVLQKQFKKRVRFFNQRGKRRGDPVAAARLWYGIRHGLKANNPTTLAIKKQQNPSGFEAKMQSGHKGLFYRKQAPRRVGAGARGEPPWNRSAQRRRGALPIKEIHLDLSPGAEAMVRRHAKRAMKTVYVDVFKSDYKRRIDKVRTKNNSLLQKL